MELSPAVEFRDGLQTSHENADFARRSENFAPAPGGPQSKPKPTAVEAFRHTKDSNDAGRRLEHLNAFMAADRVASNRNCSTSCSQLMAMINLLERIDSRLAALTSMSAFQPPSKTVGRKDLAALAALLPPVATVIKDGNFVVHELVSEQSLQGALTLALGPDYRNRTRSLGRLMARAENVNIGGLRVERMASAGGCVLWKIARVS